MIDERWNALEADFQRFYAADLGRFVVDAGVRRLWALVDGLPPEAAVWREDFPFVTTDPRALLGLMIEEFGRWSLIQIAAGRGNRLDRQDLKLLRLRKTTPVTTDRRQIRRFFNG